MRCCAVRNNLKPDRGTSGESSDCTATLSGYIGDSTVKQIDISTPKHPNKFALVDNEDYESALQYKWYVVKNGNYFYAYANRKLGKDKKHHTLHMHRVIMGLRDDKIQIDHINRNGLDNRKSNLRLCNMSQNMMNSRPMKNRLSKYKGVSWHSLTKKWRVRVCLHGNLIEVGLYSNEEKAAAAYNKEAKRLFGDFAYLNPVKG